MFNILKIMSHTDIFLFIRKGRRGGVSYIALKYSMKIDMIDRFIR